MKYPILFNHLFPAQISVSDLKHPLNEYLLDLHYAVFLHSYLSAEKEPKLCIAKRTICQKLNLSSHAFDNAINQLRKKGHLEAIRLHLLMYRQSEKVIDAYHADYGGLIESITLTYRQKFNHRKSRIALQKRVVGF